MGCKATIIIINKLQDMGEVPWEEWLADVSWLANEC